jgi:Spy/CpxP family protein refolding chaperone
MKKKTTITIILAAALLITGTVVAAPGWGARGDRDCWNDRPNMPRSSMHSKYCGPGKPGSRHFGGMHGDGIGIHRLLLNADKLNLTEQQQSKLKNLAETFALERVDLKSDIEKARIKLNTLRAENSPSQNAVFSAIDNLSAKRAQMQKMMFRHRQAINDTLTPEQRDQLKELRNDRMKRGPWFDADDDDDNRPRRSKNR